MNAKREQIALSVFYSRCYTLLVFLSEFLPFFKKARIEGDCESEKYNFSFYGRWHRN